MRIRVSNTNKLQNEPSQTKMKSYGYAKNCDKREMKKEIKQRDLVRKSKMGYFEV